MTEEQKKKSGLDRIRIKGGQRLEGTIKISGAKNAALPLLCIFAPVADAYLR